MLSRPCRIYPNRFLSPLLPRLPDRILFSLDCPLLVDFPKAVAELENALLEVTIPIDERQIQAFGDLKPSGYEPMSKQRRAIETRISRKKNPLTFRDAFIDKFVGDKFGEA